MIIFCIFIFSFIGIYLIFKASKYLILGKKVKGKIININTSTNNDSPNNIYSLDIEINNKICKNKYNESRIALIEKKFKINDNIDILYIKDCDFILLKSVFTYFYFGLVSTITAIYCHLHIILKTF